MSPQPKLSVAGISALGHLALVAMVFAVLASAPNSDGTGGIWLLPLLFPAGWIMFFVSHVKFGIGTLAIASGLNASLIYGILSLVTWVGRKI